MSEITPFNLRFRTLKWMLVSLELSVFSHFYHAPIWTILLCVLFALWRFMMSYRQWKGPSNGIKFLLTISAFLMVLGSFSSFGRDAGISLLILMTGLKLLEMHTKRDAMIIIFLGYFIIVTFFLYSQELIVVFYMILVVILNTMVMLDLNDPCEKPRSWRQHFKLSSLLLIQAIPIMLLLFVLFPRLSGPLWGLPNDASSGVTGLSDSMSPGKISQLSQSNAVAFRVNFDAKMPDKSLRYWRGPVFWNYDGITWRPNEYLSSSHFSTQTPEGKSKAWFYPGFKGEQSISYRIIIEPHNQKWLFALDMPYKSPLNAQISRDYQMTSEKVQFRRRYQASSYLKYRMSTLSLYARTIALNVPRSITPRVRKLAELWKQQSNGDHLKIVQFALNYFSENKFIYSLEPPRLGKNVTDEFLFETREGFCEHYSSAFTLMMRLAGIPAKVVTGYLGGEVNPLADYMIVRQSDAHAWSEVWIENQGWLRVDPTSAVLPERIQVGLMQSIAAQYGDASELRKQTTSLFKKAMDQVKYGWDAMNNAWYENVLAYGPELQQDLFGSLGFVKVTLKSLLIGLTGVIIFWLMVILTYFWWVNRTIESLCVKAYRLFCKKLAKRGVNKKPWEGAYDFSKRAQTEDFEHAVQIKLISDLYCYCRFSKNYHRRKEKLLWQLVKKL